jgi:transposase InsO family protein
MRELAWIHETMTWATRTGLRTALFDYIEGFYNPERIQRRLNQRSPANFEQDSAA